MPGYRPPSTEPRGKWARAIHRKRRADGLSQQAAFELLGPRLGFGPKSRAAYVALDLGARQPTEPESEVLAEWLGAYPEDTMAEDPARHVGSSADLSELREALMSQAESMARMLQFAIRRDQSVEARIRAMEAELQSLRGRLGVEGSPTQSTPPQTGGSVD